MIELATLCSGCVLLPWLTGSLLLFAVLAIGFLVSRALFSAPGWLEYAAFSFPLGTGLTTFVLFLMSWAGIRLTWVTLTLEVVLLLAFGILLSRSLTIDRQGGSTGQRLALGGLLLPFLLGLGILAAYLSIARSHSTYDVTGGWAVKGYGIALEGTIFAAREWGLWSLAYPLNIPLLHTAFMLVGAESIPLSKLVPTLYSFSLLFIVLRYWQGQGLAAPLAALGILVLATNPLIFLHSTMGFANLPFSCYLIGAILLGLEGMKKEDRRLLLAAGVILGIGTWTRAEGIGYSLVILLTFLLLGLIEGGRQRAGSVLWIVSPVALFGLTWMTFGWRAVGDSHLGVAMRGVLPQMMDGQLNLTQLYLVPRLFLERAVHIENWGLFVPIVLGLGTVGIVGYLIHQRPLDWGPLLFAGAMSAVPVGLFYVRSFTRIEDFRELLIRSFDRAFLPGYYMLVIAAFVIFWQGWSFALPAGADPEERRPPGGSG